MPMLPPLPPVESAPAVAPAERRKKAPARSVVDAVVVSCVTALGGGHKATGHKRWFLLMLSCGCERRTLRHRAWPAGERLRCEPCTTKLRAAPQALPFED